MNIEDQIEDLSESELRDALRRALASSTNRSTRHTESESWTPAPEFNAGIKPDGDHWVIDLIGEEYGLSQIEFKPVEENSDLSTIRCSLWMGRNYLPATHFAGAFDPSSKLGALRLVAMCECSLTPSRACLQFPRSFVSPVLAHPRELGGQGTLSRKAGVRDVAAQHE
jgi:hypothetical protein